MPLTLQRCCLILMAATLASGCAARIRTPVAEDALNEYSASGLAEFDNDVGSLVQIAACRVAPIGEVATAERFVRNLAWQRIPRVTEDGMLARAERLAASVARPTSARCSEMNQRWAAFNTSMGNARSLFSAGPTAITPARVAAVGVTTTPTPTITSGLETAETAYDVAILTITRMVGCLRLSVPDALDLSRRVQLITVIRTQRTLSDLLRRAVVVAAPVVPPSAFECRTTVPEQWAAVSIVYGLPSLLRPARRAATPAGVSPIEEYGGALKTPEITTTQ